MKWLIGTTINNRFILESIIGQGGMGCVFKALDLRKQEANNANPYVAIKILNKELSSYQGAIELLEQESCNTQELRHPNIVTVNDFDRDGEYTYITMELLEGETLRELINKKYKDGMPYNKAIHIVEVISDALIFAHNKGITHRDFKPENIFITNQGDIRVLDFGIAKKVKNESSSTPSSVELDAISPAYSSFEMFYDFEPEPIDDVYSLACVTFELFTGKHPFNATKAPEAKRLSLTPEPVKNLSRSQNQALLRALAWERQNRTPDVAQFVKELKHIPVFNFSFTDNKIIVSLFCFIVILIIAYMVFFTSEPVLVSAEKISASGHNASGLESKKNDIKKISQQEQSKIEQKTSKNHKAISDKIVINSAGEKDVGENPTDIQKSADTLTESLSVSEKPDSTVEPQQIVDNPDTTKKTNALTSEPVIFYSGSTVQEIEDALALCQNYSNSCERSWYETEYYRKIKISPFTVDKFEVSAKLFAEFVMQTGYETDAEKRGFSFLWNGEELEKAYGYTWKNPQGPESSYLSHPDFPVVNVSWNDANVFCRSKGGRLPSVEEWEYTARGTNRRLYPWGEQWISSYLNHSTDTLVDVDSIPEGATPEGIHHLAGNVWEWTRSRVKNQGYYLKGGSYLESNPANFRAAMSRIDKASSSSPDDGFRCSYRVRYWPVTNN